MLLVPRQLQRSGMTGDVPYYGGRLTPAHTYALTHPGRPVPTSVVRDTSAIRKALRTLLDERVISPQEHDQLLGRVQP